MFEHPKKKRLLKREEFRRLFHTRQKFYGSIFSVEYVLRKDISYPRLGITITKQCGKANKRNLFKRRVKELFRQNTEKLNFGIDMNIRAKPKLPSPSFELIQQEFNLFLKTFSP